MKKENEYDKYKREPWNSPKGLIFVSPDGGETVYIQKKSGKPCHRHHVHSCGRNIRSLFSFFFIFFSKNQYCLFHNFQF